MRTRRERTNVSSTGGTCPRYSPAMATSLDNGRRSPKAELRKVVARLLGRKLAPRRSQGERVGPAAQESRRHNRGFVFTDCLISPRPGLLLAKTLAMREIQ